MIDIKELTEGFGIGLLFSAYWKVGLFLVIMTACILLLEKDEEKRRKKQ